MIKKRPGSRPVDIYEDDQGLVFLVDLPGVEKEAVCVEIKGQTLTIRGERAGAEPPPETRRIRTERCFGPFHRSFAIGREMDPKRIRAAFSKGVLKVTILRPEAEAPKKVTISMKKNKTTS